MAQHGLRNQLTPEPTDMDAAAIQRLVPELFRVSAELEAAEPSRYYTPDGHLVESIGEVIAAARYGLTLTTASTKGVDAHDSNGRSIEIKATLGSRGFALHGLDPEAEHLLVLRVNIVMALKTRGSTVQPSQGGEQQERFKSTINK